MNAVLQSMFALSFSRDLVDELKSYFQGESTKERKDKVSLKAPFTLYASLSYSHTFFAVHLMCS